MKRLIVACFASAIAVGAFASAASAEPGWCGKRVSAKGHANIQEANPERLSCRRARQKWSTKVRFRCDRSSPWWWRARDKNVQMDAGAGQRYCTASARPARKIF